MSQQPAGLGLSPGPDLGLARAAADGHATSSVAYVDEMQSIGKVVEKVRAGYVDPAVRGYAGRVIMDAGNPRGVVARAQAILDDFRKHTIYGPDPVGTDYVMGAAGTLCLRPGLCVPIRDCDCGVTALASEYLSVGIPTQIVKQNFGPKKQQHVVLAIQDERNRWLLVDPSTTAAVGLPPKASDEVWIDPLAGVTPQLIGVGAPPMPIYEGRYGTTWASIDGGKTWMECGMGLGAPPFAAAGYQIVTDGAIHLGLRYRIQLIFATSDLLANGDVPTNRQYLTDQLGNFFAVESLGPDGSVTGLDQSWTMQGLAKNDDAVTSLAGARLLNPTVTNVTVQASAPSPAVTPGAAKQAASALATTAAGENQAPSSVGLGKALVVGAALATVGGIGWAYWKSRTPKRRAPIRRARRYA